VSLGSGTVVDNDPEIGTELFQPLDHLRKIEVVSNDADLCACVAARS
jgi:hypothetical protein